MIQKIDKYSIIGKLADSDTGVLYKAHDDERSCPVAIRLLAPDFFSDPVSKENLYRACRSAARLRHPGIVELYAQGEEESGTFVAMELADPSDLKSLIAKGPSIPLEARLSIMIQIADVLNYAHENGVVHHNLKPNRIHITPAGFTKVRGFEFSALIPAQSRQTEATLYAAPEQILGKECGREADIFAAGILFYELLTCTHPFSDPHSGNTREGILSQNEIATLDKYPNLPLGCWPIVETCLQKNPSDRVASMEEVGRACRELLEDIAEGSELMLKELRGALPRLKTAVQRPGSGIRLAKLLRDMEKLIQNNETPDHLSLQELTAALADHSLFLRTIARAEKSNADSYRAHDSAPDSVSHWIRGALGQPNASSSNSGMEQGVPQFSLSRPGASAALLEDPAVCQEPGLAGQSGEITPGSTASEHDGFSPPDNPIEADKCGLELEAAESIPAGVAVELLESRVIRTSNSKAPGTRIALWVVCGLFLLVAVYGVESWIQNSYGISSDDGALLLAGRTSLDGKRYEETVGVCLQILSKSPEDARAKSLLEEARQGKKRMAVEDLLTEAQGLVARGHFQESRAPLQTILRLDPVNVPALSLWDRVKPGAGGAGNGANAEKDIAESIASASALLHAGKLDQAKGEIEGALRIDAGNIQALALQKQWNSELSAQKARKHRDEMEPLRKQEKDLEWTRRAEKLYKEGKYSDLQAVLDQWIAANPQSAAALALRIQSAAVLRSFKLYDLAMNDKRYDDALSEVGRAEQMNPGDPALAELRKRAESRRSSARATLTVYRIGEPAVLMLDDEPIGTNGQVEGLSLRAGRHQIALKNSRGLEASRSHEFMDGQNAFMVYDASGPSLRLMTDADRDLVNVRRAAEQVQRFAVEHKHMWLRGKCAGDLVISVHEVEYKSKMEAHAFRIPFRRLYLKAEGQKVGIYFRSDDKELRSFEVKDVAQAGAIQNAWNSMKALVN